MTPPPKPIILGAHFPGVNNHTVWSDPDAGSQMAIESFIHLARTAEQRQVRLLLPRRGPSSARASRADLRPRRRRPARHPADPGGAGGRDRAPRPHRHAQRHLSTRRTSWPASWRRSTTCRAGGPDGTWSRRRTRSSATTSAGAASCRTNSATSAPARSSGDGAGAVAVMARRRPRRRSPNVGCSPAPRRVGSSTGASSSTSPGASTCRAARRSIPVILQAGDSSGGRDLGAAIADGIFTPFRPPRRGPGLLAPI